VQARSWCDDNVMTLRKHHDHDSDARQRVHIPVRLSIMSRQAIPRCDPGTLLNQCRLHETKKHTVEQANPVFLCLFITNTTMLYWVPSVSPWVTAPILRLLPSLATPGPSLFLTDNSRKPGTSIRGLKRGPASAWPPRGGCAKGSDTIERHRAEKPPTINQSIKPRSAFAAACASTPKPPQATPSPIGRRGSDDARAAVELCVCSVCVRVRYTERERACERERAHARQRACVRERDRICVWRERERE
jgi:hypothetical protein